MASPQIVREKYQFPSLADSLPTRTHDHRTLKVRACSHPCIQFTTTPSLALCASRRQRIIAHCCMLPTLAALPSSRVR